MIIAHIRDSTTHVLVLERRENKQEGSAGAIHSPAAKHNDMLQSTGGEASHEPQIETPPHARGLVFTLRVVIGTLGGSEAQHGTDQQDGLQHAGSRQATPNSRCRRPQTRVGSGVVQSAASLPQEHNQQHVLPVATIRAVKLPHVSFSASLAWRVDSVPSWGKRLVGGEEMGISGTVEAGRRSRADKPAAESAGANSSIRGGRLALRPSN
jgi:hypothetical protein